MATNIEEIAEKLDSLTLLEASQLSKLLQEKWGVSAAAAVAVAAPGAAAGAAGGGAGARGGAGVGGVPLGPGGKKKPSIKGGCELSQPGLQGTTRPPEAAPHAP